MSFPIPNTDGLGVGRLGTYNEFTIPCLFFLSWPMIVSRVHYLYRWKVLWKYSNWHAPCYSGGYRQHFSSVFAWPGVLAGPFFCVTEGIEDF